MINCNSSRTNPEINPETGPQLLRSAAVRESTKLSGRPLLRQRLSNKCLHYWPYSEYIKVVAEQLQLLLWAARTKKPLYLLLSCCSSSFQLQPVSTLTCQANHVGRQTSLQWFHMSGQNFLGRRVHEQECCNFLRPVGLLHMHLKNVQDFLIRANARYKQLDTVWNLDEWLTEASKPEVITAAISIPHSNFMNLWSRRHPGSWRSTFTHRLTSEELSSPLLERLQEAHQPEVEWHTKIVAEEQL